MSAANSAAKKRRAPPEPIAPPMRMGGPPPPQSGAGAAAAAAAAAGLTLPQVIALIDKRLVNLEQQVAQPRNVREEAQVDAVVDSAAMDALMQEFNARFEILAEEIANIKNIVLNLQSYTMEVNKMLLEDRTLDLSIMGARGATAKLGAMDALAPAPMEPSAASSVNAPPDTQWEMESAPVDTMLAT